MQVSSRGQVPSECGGEQNRDQRWHSGGSRVTSCSRRTQRMVKIGGMVSEVWLNKCEKSQVVGRCFR